SRKGILSVGPVHSKNGDSCSGAYKKHKIFYKLQEFKILGQFLNDVANISSIGLAYFQSSNQQCSTCKYTIQLLKLKSLTYPERILTVISIGFWIAKNVSSFVDCNIFSLCSYIYILNFPITFL
uniref:Uncharacterized protein n=1 Tax=Capra hircus TaxID=9925 RepID=A0A8C2QQ97_CAPHI